MAKLRHIPGIDKGSVLRKKWFVELVGSGPPLIAASVAAQQVWVKDQQTGVWLLTGATWLLVAAVVKVLNAREQDRDAAARKDHDGLLAAMHVLQASVGARCAVVDAELSDRLRVTFHRVVPPMDAAEWIEQIIPYVGGSHDGAGRKFSVRSGITGAAVRTREPHVSSRTSDDEKAYVKELKEMWGFTDLDAKSLSKDRFASMAVPILHDGKALGVVYLDSDRRDFFAQVEVQEAVIQACAGISRYISERYSS